MSKICFLVGGSRGLGRALFEEYQQAGFEVLEFSRSGSGDHHISLDLSRRETAIDTVDQVFAEKKSQPWQEIHLVLNAAVIDPLGPLFMSEPKEWWSHLDVNLTLPITIMGRFQTHFRDLNCRKVIGFMSSGLATNAMDGASLYCASKAGVEHFVRSMALEQTRQPHPIVCVNLNPGVMDTDMQTVIRSTSHEQLSHVEKFKAFQTQGDLVPPPVVAANTVRVLTGDLDNGSTIRVAG